MTDQERWKLFLGGNKDALSQIFLDFHDDLFNYGMKLAGESDLIKDCIQDLFLKLWKNRSNLDSVQVIKPYLLKSLRHHIQDSIQLRKSRQFVDFESMFEVVYSHEDFLIGEQITQEVRKKVVGALNQLSPRQREAIYLRYFEDLDFETIGQVMEMNVQSVRNIIHRGMQVMRDLMVLHAFFIMLGKTADLFNIQS
jgi:RNA polymerase sigma factor (sigma-70 family)